MDGIKLAFEAIKEGVTDSSSATNPRMQVAISVLMLWGASPGLQLPQAVDTSVDVITQDNADKYLAAAV